VRGVIEGFYGPPWSFDTRRTVMRALAARGMNAYVYAPKDDAFHRGRWREPYPSAELAALLELHEDLRDLGVRFGFALSPGLDIDYDDAADRAALWRKLEPFSTAGVDWFVLAFDDVPLRSGSGAAQASLTRWVRDQAPGSEVSVVPTDYVGTRASPYLTELTTALPPDTDVMWTGPTVVSPTITTEDARARREAAGGLPLLVWDNYPVNDAFMTASLHLGPLTGRDPGLAGPCRGLLANPMPQGAASFVALATVADYLADPEHYDPASAWERALAAVPSDAGPAPFRALARACAASALSRRVPLADLVDAVRAGDAGALDTLEAELHLVSTATVGLRPELRDEVEPWAAQATREAGAGLAAVNLLRGPSAPDAWSGVLGTMGLLLAWSAARAGAKVAYGPRFACYPAIVQGPDGSVAVDGDLAVVEDANAIDALCRHALDRASPPPPPESAS